MNAILARIRRGYARMWGWAMRPFGRRGYRFDGEQANHAEQAAQTETSLRLMVEAAQHNDDEHRIQAMQTELTLRGRKHVLEEKRAKDGLTEKEGGELASIDRTLAGLTTSQEPAQPAGRFQNLWDAPPPTPRPQGALYRVGGFLIGLGQWLPILAVVGAVFAITGWGSAIWNGVKIGFLERRVEQLTEQRDAACSTSEIEGRTSRSACRQLAYMQRQAVENARIARAQAAASADNLRRERARRSAAAAEERRRQRDIRQVDSGGPPPDWERSLREPDPVEEQPAGGDTEAGVPR